MAYLHGGLHVLDAANSAAGVGWAAEGAARRLTKQRLIEPLIIVAIPNMGEDRIHEYAPTRAVFDTSAPRKKRSRGLLRKYGLFLRDELKPFNDRPYRTPPEAEATGPGGAPPASTAGR